MEMEQMILSNDGETSTCQICFEDVPKRDVLELSECSHNSCKNCLSEWILQLEFMGGSPECPYCRQTVAAHDVELALGRPFQQKQKAPRNEPVDGETQQWLDTHAQACPGCGAWIEKASGCDKLQCVCGYRFCYSCGTENAECDCNPQHHRFICQNETVYVERLSSLMYTFLDAVRATRGDPSAMRFRLNNLEVVAANLHRDAIEDRASEALIAECLRAVEHIRKLKGEIRTAPQRRPPSCCYLILVVGLVHVFFAFAVHAFVKGVT